MNFNSKTLHRANKVFSMFVTISIIGLYANIPAYIAYADDSVPPDASSSSVLNPASPANDPVQATDASSSQTLETSSSTVAPTTPEVTPEVPASAGAPLVAHENIESLPVSNPILTLNGANPMYVTVGSTFVDPGINFVGGNPSDYLSGIVRGGGNADSGWSVDTSNPATLTITYTVTEYNGSDTSVIVGSSTITRTVNIVSGDTPECTNATTTIVSDTTTTFGVGENPAALAWVSPTWSASIPGASWIWKDAQVQNPTSEETYNFTKTFNVSGDVNNAELNIAADNIYSVTLNGHVIAGNYNEVNYSSVTQYNIDPTLVIQGQNTLVFTVKNLAHDWRDYTTNPAGLLYSFSYNSSSCGNGHTDEFTAPTISLNGSDPMIITFGHDFVDPGATASDITDGDLTSKIVSSGGPIADVWAPSTTTLLYFVTNSHGLSASVTRTVIYIPGNDVPECTNATTTLVSGTSTMVGENLAALTWVSPAWSASIPGASWIWKDAQVQNPDLDETYNFTKTFNVSGDVNSAELTIAADNIYSVTLNGHMIAGNYGGFNYASTTQYVIDPTLVIQGQNTLVFTVKNISQQKKDYTENPAGLLYEFSYNSSSCGNGHTDEFTAPTISLIGSDPVYVTFGSIFVDPGATATDTNDGSDLTSKIVISGGPIYDTSSPSTTTFLYFVTNSHGLSASVTRNVVYVPVPVPNNSPIITLNGNNPFTVTVGGTFTDPGATATTTVDGDTLSEITVTGGPVDTSVVGTTTLVYTVTDQTNGLSASTTRTVVVASSTDQNTNDGGGTVSATSFSSSGSSGSFISLVNPIVGTTSCPFLFKYMRLGANNDPAEVTKLQVFLNRVEGQNLAVTGIFDQATFDAVNAFQAKYLSDTMAPWGASKTSGYVYITTLKKINQIMCQSPLTLTADESAVINAYKQGQINGQSTGTTGTNNETGSTTESSTTPGTNEIGQSTTNSNAAAAGNAPIIQRLWDFVKGMF